MRTQGLEIGLETTNIKTADFSWHTSFIYSRAKNEITKLLTSPNIADMVGYNSSDATAAGNPVEGRDLQAHPLAGPRLLAQLLVGQFCSAGHDSLKPKKEPNWT